MGTLPQGALLHLFGGNEWETVGPNGRDRGLRDGDLPGWTGLEQRG